VKIIVVQKKVCDLRAIKSSVARLNKKRSNEIVYSRNLEEILLTVANANNERRVLVVSGQLILLSHECRLGTELAQLVKRANPQTFFCIWSATVEVNEFVDAVIPKNFDGLLEKILASDSRNLFREDFKRNFPIVRMV
jgi:transcription elongation factor GreA-like protein